MARAISFPYPAADPHIAPEKNVMAAGDARGEPAELSESDGTSGEEVTHPTQVLARAERRWASSIGDKRFDESVQAQQPEPRLWLSSPEQHGHGSSQWKDRRGVTMIEYALIAACVALVSFTIVQALGTNLTNMFYGRVNATLTAAVGP